MKNHEIVFCQKSGSIFLTGGWIEKLNDKNPTLPLSDLSCPSQV
jgi:hypothetical protein